MGYSKERRQPEHISGQEPLPDLEERIGFLRMSLGKKSEPLIGVLTRTGGRIPVEGPLAKDLRRAMAPYVQASEIDVRSLGDQSGRLHGQPNI